MLDKHRIVAKREEKRELINTGGRGKLVREIVEKRERRKSTSRPPARWADVGVDKFTVRTRSYERSYRRK